MEILTDALVLIVEETLCTRCGSTSRASLGLFIRCRNGKHKTVYKKIEVVPVRSFLHTATKVVGSCVNACECCFPAEDERQLTLFPSCFGARFVQVDAAAFGEREPKPDAIALAKEKKKKKEAKPKKVFTLEDF